MIYLMSTKTLVKKFSKMYSPEEILGCTFIRFSERILAPSSMERLNFHQSVFFLLTGDRENDFYLIRDTLIEDYKTLETLCRIISISLVKPNKVFIILCSPKEFRTNYPSLYAEVIEDMFGYPIINLNEIRSDYEYNDKDVLHRVTYYTAKVEVLKVANNPSYVEKYSKKEKKKILSKLGHDVKGLSNEELDVIFHSYEKLPFHI